jgi:hypothetical protein
LAGQSPAFSPLAHANLTNFLQYTAHRGYSPMDFGAVADGNTHTLRELYGSDIDSLTRAQADFPFVTSLDQQRDWAALQMCFNLAQIGSPLHYGKNIYLPQGKYYLDNTITLQAAYGVTVRGDGYATQLVWNGSASAGPLAIYGC